VPLPLAAALLALLATQVGETGEPPSEPALPSSEAPSLDQEEQEPAVEFETEAEAAASPFPRKRWTMTTAVGLGDVVVRAEDLQDVDLQRSHIAFLPSSAAPVRSRVGTHLATGLMSQLRTRTLSAQTGYSTWDTDLELVPALALYAVGHRARFNLSYAPRLYFPGVYHGGPMSALHRATTRLEWSPSSNWALAAWGTGTTGDFSQLVQSSATGQVGTAGGSLQPIRSYLTYPYLSLDANGSAAWTASQRLRLRFQGGWSDTGGLGTLGQQNQPRSWGPRVDASADLFLGARTMLTTTAAATVAQVVNGTQVRVLAGSETWSRHWSGTLETSASLGAGLVNNDPLTSFSFGRVLPALGAKATWVKASRDMVRVISEVSFGPYLDTYLQAAYQRLSGRVGLEYFKGRTLKLEATLASALVPFTSRPRESYAVAGASATWSPNRWVTLLAGGYAQTQLVGTGDARFVQLTGYLSVSLQSPDTP
jgi:hypothetical protein